MMGFPCASSSMAGLRCSGACCANGALAMIKTQAVIAMAPATAVVTNVLGRREDDHLASRARNRCIAKSPYKNMKVDVQSRPGYYSAQDRVGRFHLGQQPIEILSVQQAPVDDDGGYFLGVLDRLERIRVEQDQIRQLAFFNGAL